MAGQAQVRGGPARPMHRDTLFDLASLTKVVATLPAVLRLAGLGALALDDRVTRFLPGFAGAGRDAVTVRQLLAHTAGLPATVPFWEGGHDPDEAGRALLGVPLGHPPETRVVYSDVGFMLLAAVVSAITGSPFEASVAELVTGPLGMTGTGFRPGPAQAAAGRRHRAAAGRHRPDRGRARRERPLPRRRGRARRAVRARRRPDPVPGRGVARG